VTETGCVGVGNWKDEIGKDVEESNTLGI